MRYYFKRKKDALFLFRNIVPKIKKKAKYKTIEKRYDWYEKVNPLYDEYRDLYDKMNNILTEYNENIEDFIDEINNILYIKKEIKIKDIEYGNCMIELNVSIPKLNIFFTDERTEEIYNLFNELKLIM